MQFGDEAPSKGNYRLHLMKNIQGATGLRYKAESLVLIQILIPTNLIRHGMSLRMPFHQKYSQVLR